MNKAELVEEIARVTKQSKSVSKDFLEAFVNVIGSSLKKEDSVVMTGFGTFSVMKRQARVGVNPASGKKMTIPAKTVPKFKPGKALKDMVA